jgi:hypothetical protein
MAVSREQAVLEILVEFADTLKGFDTLQSQYARTIESLRSSTDKADIDRLTRDAEEARDAMERLARAGQAQLRKLADAGGLAGDEYKELQAELRRVEDAIDAADKELAQFNRTGKDVDQLGAGVDRLRGAWLKLTSVVAALGIARALREAVVAANEKQAALAQLEARLQSTKGVIGLTRDELVKLAEAFGANTLAEEKDIIAAENVLLTYTQIGSETFPRALRAALDMSTALGETLTASAERVGRAIGYPTRATAALSQQGFVFTKQQIEQIRVLEESGRMAEAQAIILEELELAYEGAAEAAANTFAGAQEKARQAAGDFLEEIGSQGLSRELAVLSKLLTENAGGTSELSRGLGQLTGFVASLIPRVAQAFLVAQGLYTGAVTGFLILGRLLVSGLDKTFSLVERIVVGAVERIAQAIPDVDLPGRTDDALRKWAGRVAVGLEAGRQEAENKRKEIIKELDILVESFNETALGRFEGAVQIGRDLARIRDELTATGAAAAGVRPELDGAGDALEAFRLDLFGNAEALRLTAQRIVELVQSLGGLAGATAAQREKIGAEVQKLVDGFALIGERPPVALEILAKQMGITASSIKADADKATASLKGLVDAAKEAARVPSTRFSADLELDEGTISEELAAVQKRLEELRSGLLIDPAEEHALLERESDLLIDLQRAQTAWQEAIEGTAASLAASNQTLAQGIDLQERELALIGRQADSARRRDLPRGTGTEAFIKSGTEASAVVLPKLNREQLEAARASGLLDASLAGIAERLLVTSDAQGRVVTTTSKLTASNLLTIDVLGDLIGLQSTTTDLWADYAEQAREATRREIPDAFGLQADELGRVNENLRNSLVNTGLLFDNVDDAATVTLPALDEAFLRSAEESGALDASLEGIAERLLVTAGNAERQGQALQAAGGQAAAGQREAAQETRAAGEEVEAQKRATEALLSAWTQYVEAVKRDGPAIKEAWAGIRVEAAGAAAECERLAACSGAR